MIAETVITMLIENVSNAITCLEVFQQTSRGVLSLDQVSKIVINELMVLSPSSRDEGSKSVWMQTKITESLIKSFTALAANSTLDRPIIAQRGEGGHGCVSVVRVPTNVSEVSAEKFPVLLVGWRKEEIRLLVEPQQRILDELEFHRYGLVCRQSFFGFFDGKSWGAVLLCCLLHYT